ncbi:MAG: DHH family phosphoesterase, partial [Oscillospiraceae bacterium]
EYTAFSSAPSEDDSLSVCYFINDTKLKCEAREFHLTRPVIIQIVVDTYEEVLKELKESRRAQIMARLDQMVEDIANNCNGVSMKLGSSRYNIIIEERYFKSLYDSQFDILARARAIDEDTVTLSIGVGRTGKDFAENDMLSRQALDMALGRGGDQAVVKSADGYEFFGGTLPSVEKRSKVRSRIVARALKDVILQSDNVLIMGHKMSDLDAIGAAVGIASAVQSCDKVAHIVVNEDYTLAENLIEWVKKDGGGDMFITADRANHYTGANTLLIIVDTHVARMTESEELCKKCGKVVVIDHHRRMVDYISNTVVSYHEPYASSASELVTELVQYIMPATYRLSQVRAGAMLAGIMLDTRNFSEKSGVRTFEAAAFLRRQGAMPTEVLKLFSVPKEVYTAKSQLVSDASTYRGVAISLSEELPKELTLAVPQAANDLLGLDGVEASIVAVKIGDQVNVSARSLGEINVQVLMEYIGGGGHLTMAGAQLKNATLEEAKEKLKESIDNYRK